MILIFGQFELPHNLFDTEKNYLILYMMEKIEYDYGNAGKYLAMHNYCQVYKSLVH